MFISIIIICIIIITIIHISMTNDETNTTMAPPWSMVSSSSDRRHGDMDDGDDDDDTDDDDTDDDTDDDHDDATVELGQAVRVWRFRNTLKLFLKSGWVVGGGVHKKCQKKGTA